MVAVCLGTVAEYRDQKCNPRQPQRMMRFARVAAGARRPEAAMSRRIDSAGREDVRHLDSRLPDRPISARSVQMRRGQSNDSQNSDNQCLGSGYSVRLASPNRDNAFHPFCGYLYTAVCYGCALFMISPPQRCWRCRRRSRLANPALSLVVAIYGQSANPPNAPVAPPVQWPQLWL